MKIMSVVGTRPEAIKMAPLVKALSKIDGFNAKLCLTGQHEDIVMDIFKLFDLNVDYQLDARAHANDIYSLLGSIISSFARLLNDVKPDLVLVHGDTSTTLACAIAAHYCRIRVAHVEAGLRSGDLYAPWPEEMNRKAVTDIAEIHYAPTDEAKGNLIREGVDEKDILVTGNTVIDALQLCLKTNGKKLPTCMLEVSSRDLALPMVLCTAHRRENWGRPFENICEAIKCLALQGNAYFVFPLHPNPSLRSVAQAILKDIPRVYLIEPQGYAEFAALMSAAHLVLTDSGGIQEEAPALGKPVLVLRATTERPEAVEAGTVRMIGTEISDIVHNVASLLSDEAQYQFMSKAHNPYGDGKASERIAIHLTGLRESRVSL